MSLTYSLYISKYLKFVLHNRELWLQAIKIEKSQNQLKKADKWCDVVLNLQSRDWGYSGGLLGFNSELAKRG